MKARSNQEKKTHATTGTEGTRDGNKGAEKNRGGNTTFIIVVLGFLDLSGRFPR